MSWSGNSRCNVSTASLTYLYAPDPVGEPSLGLRVGRDRDG